MDRAARLAEIIAAHLGVQDNVIAGLGLIDGRFEDLEGIGPVCRVPSDSKQRSDDDCFPDGHG